jgi:predicted permease
MLLVSQIALCVVLIAATGVLVRSLHNLRTVDTGFRTPNLVLFDIRTKSAAFDEARRANFYSRLLERLRTMPGVDAAALADRSPIDFSSQERRFTVQGQPPEPGGISSILVSPAYFDAFGIELTRGRLFQAADRHGRDTVAIISESTARRYFGDASPLGHTVKMGGRRDAMSIVGVVRDTRHEFLRESPPRTVYVPLEQPGVGAGGAAGLPMQLTAILRTTRQPSLLMAALPDLVRTIDQDAIVAYPRTMDQQLDAALVTERLLGQLSLAFGVLALVLTAVGLYGVMAYSVARRTRDTAIRLALGAGKSAVVWDVVRPAGVTAIAGVVIGLATAYYLSGVLGSFLFGISPRDPASLAGAAGILVLTVLTAAFVPAVRAASIDPVRSLKAE